jgi:hypothetical protein
LHLTGASGVLGHLERAGLRRDDLAEQRGLGELELHGEAMADSFDVEQPRDPEWYKRAVFYGGRPSKPERGNGPGE